eukprot:1779837-Prymnesium_polylepis.1
MPGSSSEREWLRRPASAGTRPSELKKGLRTNCDDPPCSERVRSAWVYTIVRSARVCAFPGSFRDTLPK